MKIAILSANAKLYSTRRLRDACIKRGHQARILDTLQFSIVVEENRPTLFYKSKPVSHYDAIIPRVAASVNFFGTAVVRQFEQMGVFSLNSAHAITVSRDKLRSIQVMSTHHVGIPKTAFVRQKEDLLPAIEQVGGVPVIIKLLEGTQGIGVMLADNLKVAEAIIETLHSAKQNVLIQNFVQESRGRDVRAFVVGNRVVAAMRRTAQGDEFRSNVHRGGLTEAVKLDPHYEWTAIRAAQVMGLRVAGVDILESDDGPKVMEVNSSPGLGGIEAATGIDVGTAIVEHLEEMVMFREVDIRQRLTLRQGYGIMEITVSEASEICHKTLRQAALRERDVTVLTITRGSVVIPNPVEDHALLAGDQLLCFGRTIALRSIAAQQLPKKKPPRRRPRKGSTVGDEDRGVPENSVLEPAPEK